MTTFPIICQLLMISVYILHCTGFLTACRLSHWFLAFFVCRACKCVRILTQLIACLCLCGIVVLYRVLFRCDTLLLLVWLCTNYLSESHWYMYRTTLNISSNIHLCCSLFSVSIACVLSVILCSYSSLWFFSGVQLLSQQLGLNVFVHASICESTALVCSARTIFLFFVTSALSISLSI